MANRTDKADQKEWLDDFHSFMRVDGGLPRPSRALAETVVGRVRRELHPSFSRVLTKLALIHAIAGSGSLLLCEQFGMGRGHAVSHYFMSFGEMACLAACGALFLGLTGLVAGLILSRPELRVVRRSAYAPILALGVLSLSVFFCFGAEIAVSIALVWLLGGFFAAILTIEAGLGLSRLKIN